MSAASAFRLSKSYLPAHSTFYNAVSISLRSFADAARMWCAEAKCRKVGWAEPDLDAARMWCAEAKVFCHSRHNRHGDAARMWCAEAKPDDVDLHFNAT